MYHVPLATLPKPCQPTLIPTSLHLAAQLGGFKQHYPYKMKGENIAYHQREVLPILFSAWNQEGERLSPVQRWHF